MRRRTVFISGIGLFVGISLAFGMEERHPGIQTPHTEHEADSHADEKTVSSQVGPGKAVIAADPEKGIQLSSAAIQRLGIQTRAWNATAGIPRASFVHSREETGLYRLRDGWFFLVDPRKSGSLRAGDHIVVEGAGLLRVAELSAFDSGGGNHGH